MESILEKLKRGDEREQFRFYDENKKAFLFFSKRFNLPDHEVLDVYQDACLVVFENAITGKLDQVKCSLKTYLYGVGKNLIFKRFNKNNKEENTALEAFDLETVFDPFEESQMADPKLGLIRDALAKMGKKCRGILSKFYFEEKQLEEIMLEMNYETKEVLKSQKSRCLRQLKELMGIEN